MPTQNLTVRTATGEAVLCRRLWRWVVYPVLGILLNGDSVEALSRYAGYHVYFAALGSGFHNPLFTKEFSEGQGVPRVGGKDQIQLPSQKESVGFRVGYEKLNYKRAGFGLSLTYWQTDFDDVRFQYDEAISGSRIAEYLSPSPHLHFHGSQCRVPALGVSTAGPRRVPVSSALSGIEKSIVSISTLWVVVTLFRATRAGGNRDSDSESAADSFSPRNCHCGRRSDGL